MDFNLVFLVVVISVGLFLVFLYEFFTSGDWGDIGALAESIPHSSDMPGGDWRMIEEREVFAEEAAWSDVVELPPSEWGFEAGFTRVLGRDGERAGFVILKFSSEDHAKNAVVGISGDWDENTYSISVGDESLGMHSDKTAVDGMVFRTDNLVILILVHDSDEIKKGQSANYISYFPEAF